MQKNCARCGVLFECQEDNSCWCFGEPEIPTKDTAYDDCVCKKCLQLQYRKKLLGV